MTNRGLAAGVFRAWGVMWWVYVLVGLPQFINGIIRKPYQWDSKVSEQLFLSSQAISLGCEIAVAIFLMTKATWLATVVFPIDQQLSTAFSAADLRKVLFATVGLYFLVDGARHAVSSVYLVLSRPRGDSSNPAEYVWRRAPETLALALGGIVAGAYILFGRGALLSPGKAIRSVYDRLFGLKASPDEE